MGNMQYSQLGACWITFINCTCTFCNVTSEEIITLRHKARVFVTCKCNFKSLILKEIFWNDFAFISETHAIISE